MLGFEIKTILIAAAALAAITFLGTAIYKIRAGGYNAAVVKVEENNAAARSRAIAGAADVTACYNAGGLWRKASGVCAEPEGSN